MAVALDSTFAAAYIDNGNSYRFLGVKVRPFCLWHLLLLQACRSPFITGGNATSWDLRTAIGVCRLKYRDSKIRRPLPRWMRKTTFKSLVERFSEYIGDYSSNLEYNVIPFSTGPQKPEPHVTPPPSVITTAFDAAHGARVSIGQAWDMPLGEAYIAQAMQLRLQGTRLDFMDDEEREFQKQLKESLK